MQTSTGRYFVWSGQKNPVSVHLELGTVARLHALLQSKTEGSRPRERGGILIGKTRQVNDSFIVAIEGFEEVESEHARGESWTLSRADRRRFEETLRRLQKRGAVGWFRFHSRPGLFLDQHDFEFVSQYFSEPSAVSLLLRPDAQAGFFFWHDGEMERSRPESTFTFDPSTMGGERLQQDQLEESVSGNSFPGLPALLPRWQTRSILRWSPALLGLAAGVLWTPAMLRDGQVVERNRAAESIERPLIGVPPEPDNGPATVPIKPAVMQEPAALPKAKPAVIPVSTPRTSAAVAKPRRPEPKLVEATYEPAKPSVLRKTVGAIPGLGFLKRKNPEPQSEGYVAPRALRQVRPPQMRGFDEDIRLRVRIDQDGFVQGVSLLDRNVPGPVAQAAVNAARRWRFQPATRDRKPVSSEMLITFQPVSTRLGG